MFLFYLLIIMLMFPAAGVLLLVSAHESLYLLNARQKQARGQNKLVSDFRRATQEITAILGLGDD